MNGKVSTWQSARFWIRILIAVYITIISILVMYGLKKTTRRFQNGHMLIFLLSTVDLGIVLDIIIDQILSNVLKYVRDEIWCFTIRELCYPWGNTKLSKITASRTVIVVLVTLLEICFTVFCVIYCLLTR